MQLSLDTYKQYINTTKAELSSTATIENNNNDSPVAEHKGDSFEGSVLDKYYADINIVGGKYYKGFKNNCGSFLVDHAKAIKEAENYTGTDKEYRLAKLDSAMLNQLTNQLSAVGLNPLKRTGFNHRLFFGSCAKFHNERTNLIIGHDPMLKALNTLREKFLHELNSEALAKFRNISISKRDSDGKLTNESISLQEVFSSQANLIKYINEKTVRDALINTSDHLALPEINRNVLEQENHASEEVKRLSTPWMQAAMTFIAPGVVFGLGARVKDGWFCGHDTHNKIVGVVDDLFKGSGAATVIGDKSAVFGNKALLTVGEAVTAETKLLLQSKIKTELATKGLQGLALRGAANRAMAGALFKATAFTANPFMWAWRGLGVVSRFAGVAGGPIGIAVGFIAPFVLEWAIADIQDALTVASGLQSKNKGFGQIGEWFGEIIRGFIK